MKLIFRGNQRRKRDHCETLISRTIARSCSFIHSRHWLITLERGEKKATYPPRQGAFLGRAQCGYRTSIYRFNVPRNLQEGDGGFFKSVRRALFQWAHVDAIGLMRCYISSVTGIFCLLASISVLFLLLPWECI